MYDFINRIADAITAGADTARRQFTSGETAPAKAARKALEGYQAKLVNLAMLALVEEHVEKVSHLLDEVDAYLANLTKFGLLPGIGNQIEAELGYPSLGFAIADLEFKIVTTLEAGRAAMREDQAATKAAAAAAKAAAKAAKKAGKSAAGRHRVAV